VTSPSPQVVIVGGGAIGCAIAFTLARSGRKVVLIEPDPIGGHASGNNPGNLNPLLGAPTALLPLALDSFRRHAALARDLASFGCLPYGLAPVERILLAFEEFQCGKLQAVCELYRGREGFSARLLDPASLRKLEPRLGEDIRAGLLISGNMSVDARALTRALAQGAAHFGAELVHGRVESLQATSGRVSAALVAGRAIACDSIVLATGPWVAETRRWLGLALPVEPVKGQLLKMKLPGPDLRFDLSHNEISLYRRNREEIWVGVTIEPGLLDEAPTDGARAHLLAGARRIMPAMVSAILLEHCAGIRPQGPAGLPVAGKAAAWDNVYVANGGGIKGILLCTGIAQAIQDLLIAGSTPLLAAIQSV